MPALARSLDVLARTAPLYERVKTVIPPIEWSGFAGDIAAILDLKAARNAVILAHNYQTPEIFHCVADIVGDSLALAREATKTDADVILLAGVHFMAETAKLLNPGKTVLIPDLEAGCSLAASITPEDIRLLRARHPGAPIGTYVSPSAAVKGRATSAAPRATPRRSSRGSGSPRSSCFPTNTSPATRRPRPRSRSSPGKGIARCMSASPPTISASCARRTPGSPSWRIPSARPRSSPNATSPAPPRRWRVFGGRRGPPG